MEASYLTKRSSEIKRNLFFNRFSGQHKLTQTARAFLQITQNEIYEIELCSECYIRRIQASTEDWFIKPCSIPHTLCWAKMKGYEPWPAKVLRIVNDEVEVYFFGKRYRLS